MSEQAESKVLDLIAIKALYKGEATPDQQVRFWNWLVEDVCGIADSTQRDSSWETAFQNGKREVALIFRKAVNMDVVAYREELLKLSKPTKRK